MVGRFDKASAHSALVDLLLMLMLTQCCSLLFYCRELYDRSIKSWQARELYEKYHFLHNSLFFSLMPIKQRNSVALSLHKETYRFGNALMKQGEPAANIYFVLRFGSSVCLVHMRLF